MENGSGSDTAATKALAMLSAFASVGARSFNLTLTNIEQEKVKGGYRPNTALEQLRRTIGRILDDAEKFRYNVIIRPRSSMTTLIQLDDLDFTRAERIAPHSVIVFRTSPANYQAWVAVEKNATEDFARRLRKGIAADATASGSTRIAGSRNFKQKYAPTFQRVEIIHANPGNIASMAALEQAGFVAPQEQPKQPLVITADQRRQRYGNGPTAWPSWEKCLAGAPESKSRPGQPRESPADFLFARIADQWGFSETAIADHLMEVSPKAKENGRVYVVKTVRRAIEWNKLNPYRERSTPRPA
jgi:hypothetical protein